MPEDPAQLREKIRDAHMKFLSEVQPFQGDLHRYAHGLTGCAFRAEDVCQEAIVRTFVRLGQGGDEPDNLRAYLFRVATNVWRDECRRHDPQSLQEPESLAEAEPPPLPGELGEALERLVSALPPRPRAAILLKDVFGFSLAETADALETTEGAVKAALHRGRTELERRQPSARTPTPHNVDAALVGELVRAFNARDVDRLLGLMAADAEVDLLGVFRTRRPDDTRLVVSKTLEDPALLRAEQAEYAGEPIVLLWHHGKDGGDPRLGEILRLETSAGRVTRSRWYYFCPHTIRAVALDLGLTPSTHGFHGVPD